MAYKYLLFDLDGTITDSAPGIISSVEYALSKIGIIVQDKNELYRFIGPPFHVSMKEIYGVPEEKLQESLAYYRERYSTTGIYDNLLFDGIKDLLSQLKDSGKIIVLATSKPEHFAKIILDHFDLTKYFTVIGGCNMDNTRSEKAEVIEYVMDLANIIDKKEAVMIGDRKYDVIGAKLTGIDCIGVTYGYGGYEELNEAGATYIVDAMQDIIKIVL